MCQGMNKEGHQIHYPDAKAHLRKADSDTCRLTAED